MFTVGFVELSTIPVRVRIVFPGVLFVMLNPLKNFSTEGDGTDVHDGEPFVHV